MNYKITNQVNFLYIASTKMQVFQMDTGALFKAMNIGKIRIFFIISLTLDNCQVLTFANSVVANCSPV